MARFLRPGKLSKPNRFYQKRENTAINALPTAPFTVATTEVFSGIGTEPAGTAQNDILVACVVSGSGTLTPPSGWVLDSSVIWNTNLQQSIYTIKRGASAPALTWTTASVFSTVITAVRGADLTTWIDVAGTSSAGTSTTNPTIAPVITVTNNALILFELSLLAAATITRPNYFNTDLNDGSNGIAVFNLPQASAGSTGALSCILSVSDNTAQSVVVIRPASSGANYTGTLTGQAAIATTGTLVYAFDKALTGQSVAAASGTLVYALSKALVGQPATSNTGTLTYAFDKALAGQPAAAATGALVYAFDKSLTGQAVTGTTGTVVFDSNMSFTGTLTGQSVIAATGSLSYGFDKGLTGQAVTTATGTIVYAFSTSLAGQSASAATGNISYTFSKSLIGQPSTANTGTLVYAFDKALTGQPATGNTGTVTFSSSVDFTGSLTGQNVTGATGQLGYAFSKSLTGQSANNAQGILTYSFDKALTGQSVTANTGAVTFTSASIDFTAMLTGQVAISSTGHVIFNLLDAKVGGDDVPREEYWEKRKPEIKPDNLDRIIRQTYKNIQQQEPVAIKPLETIVELAEVTSLPQQLEPMIAAIKATLQRMEDDEDEELILMLLG